MPMLDKVSTTLAIRLIGGRVQSTATQRPSNATERLSTMHRASDEEDLAKRPVGCSMRELQSSWQG